MTKQVYGENTPWKTKSALMSWIRGGLRRGLWNKHPIKLMFINKTREKIPNPNPRGKKPEVWGARCVLCEGLFPIAQIEVDHKKGNHSLKDISDIQSFVENITLVVEEDLQLVCKSCHKIKSQAEKKGITFDEAKIEKQVIEICKVRSKCLQFIEDHGIMPASNSKKRRAQVEEILRRRINE